MGYTPLPEPTAEFAQAQVQTMPQRWPLHIGLFVLTFLSCMIAGTMWSGQSPDFLDPRTWAPGWTYAVLIMSFISAHEFGHYFAARYHHVDATLPFYIPMPFVNIMPFGTMGAVIRTRSPIRSRKVLFDIGVSGPLAGFAVCVVILVVGFLTLPDKDYLYRIHPEYLSMFGGEIPEYGLRFGDTILYQAFAHFFVKPDTFIPPMNEMYHYPFLCVGWFGLFVTSLNMLPIGQLDGGHVTYAMFGRHQSRIARVVVGVLIIVGLMGALGALRPLILEDSPDSVVVFLQSIFEPPLNWLNTNAPWVYDGWIGWLMWALLARFLFRMDHPPIEDDEELDPTRKKIGWLALGVFVLSVSLNGITELEPQRNPDGTVQQKTVVQLTRPVAPSLSALR